MKFKFTPGDEKKFYKLIDMLDENILVANFYIDAISKAIEISDDYSGDIYSSLLNVLDIDKEEFERINSNHEIDDIRLLKAKEYRDNPYFKNVLPKTFKSKKIELAYLNYEPYEIFTYDDTKVIGKSFNEKTCLGYFDEKFKYLAIIEKGVIWMSITPNEIETMKEPIKKAHGKVLVYGLGLGYFPYMCSLKEDVKEIIIIERDEKVIEVFKTHILPYFPHKDKIKIVNEDAFDYLLRNEPHDYAFMDIWHTVDDGLELYVKLMASDDGKTDYWIEDSMVVMVRRVILSLMVEEYEGQFIVSNDGDFISTLMNELHSYFKDLTIERYDQIEKIIEKDEIKRIIKDLKMVTMLIS